MHFSSKTSGKTARYEYNWVDGAESLEKYQPGGYHPVMIGDILHGRYHVVDKLGFGGYSTIWLARDTQIGRYVALKIGIADSLPHETKVLRALSVSLPECSYIQGRSENRSLITIPLDEFEVQGPNGTHPCYTMAPAQCNLKEASFSRLFPLEVARALSAGLALSVSSVHSQGYVHGDIHLRNVLAKLPSSLDELSIEKFYEEYGKPETVPITRSDGGPLPANVPDKAVIPLYIGKYAEDFSLSDAHVLLSDFGEAFAPSLEPRLGKDCHTPLSLRPPEARFEPESPLSYSADIWTLATALWEIVGMKAIFSSEFVTADDVTSQQIEVLGPMPQDWWERWEERGKFFDKKGNPKGAREIWPPIHRAFEEGVQKYRRKLLPTDVFSEAETAAFLDLMRRMLVFRPEERPTAKEVLESEWMVKWALPDFERS
ncbi:protein kinase domain-containing protein [Microsporum canis CBS 113480]|uniref:non-specific serine/threonine protein kinase n=1 Tax=Arthroderma otae (strain ATCC MYA-4605 / CBS 113480) TaxID=554155 RepID=C5FYJ5_ARTOC|nr:protein kinase domain-containing protein [Microsporum canis CBS 113480]EEQ34593.1 protein kinase domain-containing protein [Microsporum canis CBS 113480]